MSYTLTIEVDSEAALAEIAGLLAGRKKGAPKKPVWRELEDSEIHTSTVSTPSPAVTVQEVQPPQDIYKELRGVMERFIAKNSAEDAKELLLSFGKERLRDLTVEDQHKLKEALEKRGYV